jgi:hypothetical protein
VLGVDATHRGLLLTQIGNTSGWDGPFFHLLPNLTSVVQLAVANEANLGMTVFARKTDQTLEAATQNTLVQQPVTFNAPVDLSGSQSDIAAIDQE